MTSIVRECKKLISADYKSVEIGWYSLLQIAQLSSQTLRVSPIFTMRPSVRPCVTLCISAQKQDRKKCNTNLEPGQIGDEDPGIKNPDFQPQESGTSFMSPKGHIWKTRHISVSLLATKECNTSNCMYFWRQIQWCNKKSRFSTTGVRNVLYVSKRTHMEDQAHQCQFFSYKRM